MSAKSSNISTKTVLVADSSGLPLVLWRAVFSFLHVVDLCRCAQVCKAWALVVSSLDITAWKRFFLESNQWKHPNWPRNCDDEIGKSWRALYREHSRATTWWSAYRKHIPQVTCFTPLQWKRENKVMHVGPGQTYTSLRGALNMAAPYDRIVIHPGLYYEEIEMSSKIPFELIGAGELGSVILKMCIEQNAPTGRLCNLVLTPPWFTEHILKVSTGHIQVDNCVMKMGEVSVCHPATTHFRYCSFKDINISFQHVNVSAVENCEFEFCRILVEGYPKETLNWTHEYLSKWRHKFTDNGEEQPGFDDRDYQRLYRRRAEVSSSYTDHLGGASSTFEVNKSEVDSIGVASIDCDDYDEDGLERDNDTSGSVDTSSDTSSSFRSYDQLSNHSNQSDMILSDRFGYATVNADVWQQQTQQERSLVRITTRNDITVSVDQEPPAALSSEPEGGIVLPPIDLKQYDNTESKGTNQQSDEFQQLQASTSVDTVEKSETTENILPKAANEITTSSQSVNQAPPLSVSSTHTVHQAPPLSMSSSQSVHQTPPLPLSSSCPSGHQMSPLCISSRSKLTSETLPLPEVLEQSSEGSDDSSQSDSLYFHGDESDKGKDGRISPLWSSDSESVVEAKLESAFRNALKQDQDLVNMVSSTQGVVFRGCVIHRGSAGVKVSQQAECRIERCELRNLLYGIRCLQNAKVAILENDIHHCETSGIFMRLAAHGLVFGNDIYCTDEAGIDVRRNADPLIQNNRIHHSKRSGIAVLGSGRGMIKGNDIYQNREAGIYVLYKGNPYIMANRICRGRAAGVTVTEHGLGYIVDNFISNNRWGGIDIRHGGQPTVCRNLICHGLADGVVVGCKGRGVIEANTVKGNDGCGIWVMDGQPLIQLNQIYNNNNTGVSFAMDKDSSELNNDHDGDSFSESSDIADHSYHGNTTTAHPHIKYNTIFHNNGCGVIAHCREPLHLHGNAIHDNKDVGVLIKQEELVTMTNNSVTYNKGCGVESTCHSKVEIEGNGIYDNTEHGLSVAGDVVLKNNDVFCNHKSAIVAMDNAIVKIHGNRIHTQHDTTIKFNDCVQGGFHDNKLFPGAGRVFDTGRKSLLQIQCNDIVENSDMNSSQLHLENPPARPHIDTPPPVTPVLPSRHVPMVTRVIVPSSVPCQQSSKLCTIL